MNSTEQEVVVQIPLTELHPFPDHPFKVRDDEAMQETAESIKEYGVLVPALARPREEGGYELIAGHCRKHGCELAGFSVSSYDLLDVTPRSHQAEWEKRNLPYKRITPDNH